MALELITMVSPSENRMRKVTAQYSDTNLFLHCLSTSQDAFSITSEMRTSKYFWRQPQQVNHNPDNDSDNDMVVQVPVVRSRVSKYGNQDLYVAPDTLSSRVDIETRETLDKKDYDNKIPIKMTAQQIDSLVDFVKDHPIFYDKSETAWRDKMERLSLLQTWAKPQGLNGNYRTFSFGFLIADFDI